MASFKLNIVIDSSNPTFIDDINFAIHILEDIILGHDLNYDNNFNPFDRITIYQRDLSDNVLLIRGSYSDVECLDLPRSK